MSAKRWSLLGIAVLMMGTAVNWAQSRPEPGIPTGRPGNQAMEPGPGHQGPPGPILGPAGGILHELDLTLDQRREIRGIIRARMGGGLGEIARAFGESRHRLEQVVWNEASTEADLEAASGAVAERARALERARRELALEVLDVLTEEQREAFREMLAAGPIALPGPPGR